ncbi:hypothetical protein MCAG_04437 [Micromonospora sp. ATCC 39149]|uniref:hypothetical protein n=1 Tax=Micromonospora sp. (strain ATCC 39149 / NRRL 15099 / SCC 1413) TaxID=219305 RepID=UPI0001A505C3|nr:hypothetical protein [Micromonospora sp. ATCC 39149]EEP74110.1 hypothetical protein MCAG_04437 [Micromonospora sp. ATCC 39149]
MRRAVSSVTVALGLLGATVALTGVALAAPALGAAAPEPKPGKKRCAITDERLRELSGLVATKTGYVVINDGTTIEQRKRVFFLDTKCKLAGEPVRYSGNGPLDTEDLALSPDGEKLWIADIGDNITSTERRERVAVWSMPVDGSARPVLHRLSYPEKKPHDAEALLIGDDGKPLIITKVATGKAEIFTPEGKLSSGDTDPVPMSRVGEVSLPKTNTPNVLNTIGRVAITGAARSPDGTKVVLRTYADAFEYDVTGGDIVGALTGGKPRVTPLTDPFGEAISYTPDGKSFVTVSDGGELGQDEAIEILAYTPATTGAEALTGGDAGPPKPAAEKSWMEGLSLDEITYLIAAVGVIGALMVGAGIFGILRARQRPVPPDESRGGPDLPERDEFPLNAGPGGPGRGRPVDGPPPGGDRVRSGVYGGVQVGGYGAAPSTAPEAPAPPAACTAATAGRPVAADPPAAVCTAEAGAAPPALAGTAARSPGAFLPPAAGRLSPAGVVVGCTAAGEPSRPGGDRPPGTRAGVGAAPAGPATSAAATVSRPAAVASTGATGTDAAGTDGRPARLVAQLRWWISSAGGSAPEPVRGGGQMRRRTATTRPMMVASSPGIGSNAGFCGISQTWPSRRR